jgi:membrane protease YdiL (CAAX protease family)
MLHSWIGWVVFAVLGYVAAMYLTAGVVIVLAHMGVFATMDATSYSLIVRLIMYALLLTAMIAIPAWAHQRISRGNMGLGRMMEWKDIAIGVAGVILYFLLAMGALALLKLIPGANLDQAQELGLTQVYGASRMMVFVVLVIITPFVEELLFRGLLYGGLRMRQLPVWAAALIVSVLFGVAHGQLNVGVDVFCLSLVACYARELTGSIWAGIVLHMIKNGIAFAIVFVVNQGS